MKYVPWILRRSTRLPPSTGQAARTNTINAQKSLGPGGAATAKAPLEGSVVRPCARWNVGFIAAALLAGAAIGGWAVSTMSTTSAAAVEDLSAFEAVNAGLTKAVPNDELKRRLIGSYVVKGTDPDGKPYAGAGIVDIALAPSGALELDWNNGKQVGIAQVIGDVLVVGCLNKGRTAVLIMTVNPDGSLSGTWSRRTDRGQKGTETWTKA